MTTVEKRKKSFIPLSKPSQERKGVFYHVAGISNKRITTAITSPAGCNYHRLRGLPCIDAEESKLTGPERNCRPW